jgi:hypothetical protein
VVIRIDSGEVFEEQWQWTSYGSFLKPKFEDRLLFLRKLKGAKKLALKVTFPEILGVFDVSGFDKAYAEVAKFCGFVIKVK